MKIQKKTTFRLAALALAFILILALLISGICALRAPVLRLLGFDLTDYEGEEIRSTLSFDSDEAKNICGMISMLLYSPSAELSEFDGADEAARLYVDSILSYLMSVNYSKYVCNLELLSLASDSYANYNFRTLIPAADFRSEVYRAFGGDRMISEKSGSLFTYHEKIDSFSTVGSPAPLSSRVVPLSLGATEHAYKMNFFIERENTRSDVYTALAIPRSDGTIYIKSIKKTR